MRSWLAAAVFMAGMGGVALAQEQGAPAPAETPVTAPAPDATAPPAADAAPETPDTTRVCRSVKVTGSRLGARRVCKTAEEWRLQAEAARTATNENIRRAGSARVPGS